MAHDEYGYPILHDVRDMYTRECVKGAPAGTWLTNGITGRRFQVKASFPLDPDYVAEKKRLDRLAALRAARKEGG